VVRRGAKAITAGFGLPSPSSELTSPRGLGCSVATQGDLTAVAPTPWNVRRGKASEKGPISLNFLFPS
jgi:hypothetical protein